VTVAEWIVHVQPAGVEPAVADVHALAVSPVAQFAWEVQIRGGVFEPHGHRLSKLAGRVHLSEQYVGDAVAVGLTGQPELDDASDGVAPAGGRYGGSVAQRDDDARVDGRVRSGVT
jgi:hypothetical protein